MFNSKAPLSDSSNAALRKTSLPTFLCPSDAVSNSKNYMPANDYLPAQQNWARGNYAGNGSIARYGQGVSFFGPHSDGWSKHPWVRGVMGINESSTPQMITDGLSHTCLLGEIRQGFCLWTPAASGPWATLAQASCGDTAIPTTMVQTQPAPAPATALAPTLW